MKQVFFVLVVAIALFTVGCQNDSATGPESTAAVQLLKPTPNTGALDLKADVIAGDKAEMAFHVTGLVTYEYRIVGEGIDAYIVFDIDTHASLVSKSPIGPSATISNQSSYQIALANKQGVIYVQRDYYVPEFNSKLHVVYGIDENNRFSVQSMSLDTFVIGGKLSSGN